VLPAEVVLLKALQAPDDKTAAQQWVDGLESAELTSAAGSIQSYPFLYRREIMRALPATRRARVWQGHIAQYIASHKELDGGAVDALRGAQRALTATALSEEASSADRSALEASAKQIEALLGREEALYVAHDLGPVTPTFASAEPLLLKMASFVRGKFMVLARSQHCDCSDDRGCGYYISYCSTSQNCQVDNNWPMCGYFWNQPCNGLCEAL
jgi:hypothetical protein